MATAPVTAGPAIAPTVMANTTTTPATTGTDLSNRRDKPTPAHGTAGGNSVDPSPAPLNELKWKGCSDSEEDDGDVINWNDDEQVFDDD